VKQAADNIVDAAVEIYQRMSVDLLPTPAKSHYVFNLRDLSKCVQGKRHRKVYKHTSSETFQTFAKNLPGLPFINCTQII